MKLMNEDKFIKGNFSFTKEEVRAVILRKLKLNEDSNLVAIGGDTLLSTLEACKIAPEGKHKIYESTNSFERIVEANKEEFVVDNLENFNSIFSINEIFDFDRMLVGNAIGRLEELIDYFYKYSKDEGIIVFKEITIEKLAKVNKLLHNIGMKEVEVICINISRNHDLLGLNMMVADNPIYIVIGKK